MQILELKYEKWNYGRNQSSYPPGSCYELWTVFLLDRERNCFKMESANERTVPGALQATLPRAILKTLP